MIAEAGSGDLCVGHAVGVEFHVLNALAEHDDPASVALLTRGGEVEQKTPPNPECPFRISFEPEPSQVDSIVQQHNVHGFAVIASRL